MTSTERISIPLGGFTFDALTAGPDDGQLALLLHGFPENSHAWEAILPPLAEDGFKVVAPDQRGYSPGARPAEVGDYAVEQLIGDVLGFADHFGAERFHLVGHDWGGAVAWQLAGRHADRLLSLTSLSTPHPAAFGLALAGELGGDQAERSAYMIEFMKPDAGETFAADDCALLKFLYEASGMAPDNAEYYVRTLGNVETLRAGLNWYRAVDITGANAMSPITTPTMYIWSDGDQALGREAAEATARFVEGPYRFEELPGVSHWIPEEAADRVSALLRDHLSGR